MTIFEHLSVFVSIILGLAVVHLLGGVSLILDQRVKAKLYGVHLAWTANMLLVIVLAWVGNFLLADLQAFNIWHFLNLVLYSMLIYLMSGLLYPVRGGEVTDFREYFHANRARFFGVGLLFVAADALDGVMEARATGIEFNPGQFATLGVFFLLFAVGIRNSSEGYNRAAAAVFFLGLLGWLYSLVEVGVVAS